MSTFYNSPIAYNDASTAYNGAPTAYSYSGSVTIFIVPNHNIFDGAHYVFTYQGRVTCEILLGSSYKRAFLYTPTLSGIRIRLVPNSSSLIRQYYNFTDPVRIGGCVQCGTYLYNEY